MNKKVKSILFTNGIRNFEGIKIIGIKNNFLEVFKDDELLKFRISGKDEEEILLEQEFNEIIESEEDDFWKNMETSDNIEISTEKLDLDNDVDLDDLIEEENEIKIEKNPLDEIIQEEIPEETPKKKVGRKPKTIT